MAHRDSSQPNINSVAIGGEADMSRVSAPHQSDANDPGCVKTHTVAKCRKNNSPGRHHASRVQYDLTLRYAIPSRSFYARSSHVLSFRSKAQRVRERPIDSERFRSDPRTCWPARGRLSVGPTGPTVDRRGPLLGGAVSALLAAPTVLSTLCAIRNCHHEAVPPGVT